MHILEHQANVHTAQLLCIMEAVAPLIANPTWAVSSMAYLCVPYNSIHMRFYIIPDLLAVKNRGYHVTPESTPISARSVARNAINSRMVISSYMQI